MLVPRPFQIENVKEILYKFTQNHRVLYVAPTGSGKTATSVFVAREALSKGLPVHFYVHRDALVSQTIDAFSKMSIRCGVVAGGHKENRSALVQIISFQTVAAEGRDLSWLHTGKRLTIADECHVTSYTSPLLERFPLLPNTRSLAEEGFYLGMTATPWRLKRTESLGQIFRKIVLAPSIAELINMGFLVKPVYYSVKQSGEMLADIDFCIQRWLEIGQNSPTFLFTQSVAYAKLAVEKFNHYGIKAAAITAKTPKKTRSELFKAFRNEEIKILSSMDTLTEGTNITNARVAIMARTTQSLSKLVQQAGRVMRSHTYTDGTLKTDCIFIDQMNLFRRFGFLEHIRINESVLNDAEPPSGREMPMKECDICHGLNYIHATICRYCGEEFTIIGTERSSPQGAMERMFLEDTERAQFAWYQRQRFYAFRENADPLTADLKFIKRFRKYPPHDWCRGSALPHQATEEQKLAYKEYLIKWAKKQNKSDAWIEGQLSLELGI